MAKTTYTYTCKNPACGKAFKSAKRNRLYCSIKCRCQSPEFKAAALANAAKARAHYKPPARVGEERPCLQCGKPIYLTKTDIERGKKTCSRHCYRLYLADRFDRAIAAPVTFAAMQGFDEFLMQDKLPCLVEGCTWEGDNLGLHMNLAHGITADEFKKLAGFNLSTGLISPRLEAAFIGRGSSGNEHTLDRPRALAAPRFDYISKERKEHASKAANLIPRGPDGRFMAKIGVE